MSSSLLLAAQLLLICSAQYISCSCKINTVVLRGVGGFLEMGEDLAIDIDGGHLFRYPSEVDPRKKATKVSDTTIND